MKVKNYFHIFLTNPHIGRIKKQICFLFARIFTKIDDKHHGDGLVLPIAIIVCLTCMTACPSGASKEVDE
ncbi:MAG: hypothetical protein C0390_10490 [Syntrophus sp. (in: bacteria)]|nr:hypothetical protein [Syntrophus sp. (in: bacteria)]